jgi:hypothetical protein
MGQRKPAVENGRWLLHPRILVGLKNHPKLLMQDFATTVGSGTRIGSLISWHWYDRGFKQLFISQLMMDSVSQKLGLKKLASNRCANFSDHDHHGQSNPTIIYIRYPRNFGRSIRFYWWVLNIL